MLRKLVLLCVMVLLATGCAKKEQIRIGDSFDLFGLEYSKQQEVESSVQAEGILFVVRIDKSDPDNHRVEWVDCPLKVPYKWNTSSLRTEHRQVRTEAELKAKLPLSQAAFQAGIEHGYAYDFEVATLGSWMPGPFQMPRTDVECAKATHYVRVLSVGAVAWREYQATGAGAEVAAGTVTVGGRASSGAGWQQVLGDLEACHKSAKAGEVPPLSCRLPLQVNIQELTARHWCPGGNQECEGRALSMIHPGYCDGEPRPGCQPQVTVATAPQQSLPPAEASCRLALDGGATGFLATQFEEALEASEKPALSEFGLNDRDAFLVGGFVANDSSTELTFKATAGDEFVAFAIGDNDAKNLDLIVAGAAEGQDVGDDAVPLVRFAVPSDGGVKLSLIGREIAHKNGSFVTLMVLRRGAAKGDRCETRQVLKQTLERAPAIVNKTDVKGFHPGQWALYAARLQKGGLATLQSDDLTIHDGQTVVYALGSSQTSDIDVGLFPAGEDPILDTAQDAEPVVSYQTESAKRGHIKVSSESTNPAIVVAAILDKGGAAEQLAECDSSTYDEVQAGARIRLGKHTVVNETDNWSSEMDPFVGQEATVTERVGKDRAGCEMVHVDADSGQHVWRLRDAVLVPSGPSLPSNPEAFAVGRWLIAKQGSFVQIWRSDNKVAAEFMDDSNGWWNLLLRGKEFTVWSTGESEASETGLSKKPWEVRVKSGAPTANQFQSGSQKIEFQGSLIIVRTVDATVVFQADGTITETTGAGKAVKF
jgi:hypothetical protein